MITLRRFPDRFHGQAAAGLGSAAHPLRMDHAEAVKVWPALTTLVA